MPQFIVTWNTGRGENSKGIIAHSLKEAEHIALQLKIKELAESIGWHSARPATSDDLFHLGSWQGIENLYN